VALQLKLVQKIHKFQGPREERTVCKDITLGRETTSITAVNGVDDDDFPADDFVYVPDYVETMPVAVNRVVTSLEVCTPNRLMPTKSLASNPKHDKSHCTTF